MFNTTIKLITIVLSSLMAALGPPLTPPIASAQSSLVPLYSWYSRERGDNFATTDPGWAGRPGDTRSPDYRFVRIEGMVFSPIAPQPPGTVVLYSWYSPGRGDNFATTDPGWAGRPGDTRSPDYRFVRLEGYIYAKPLAGTLPLYSWWSPERYDNFATTDPRWAGSLGDRRSPDYTLYRREGYMLPPAQPQPPDVPERFGYEGTRVNGVKASGSRPLLVILIEYADVRFSAPHTRDYYQRLIFGPEYPNIVHYFQENSQRKFTWTNAGILGPFVHPDNPGTAGGVNESLYNCANDRKDSNGQQLCPGAAPWEQLLTQAIKLAATASGFNFANFDHRLPFGTVTSDELTIVVIGAHPPLTDPRSSADSGAARWAYPDPCVQPTRDSAVRVCTRSIEGHRGMVGMGEGVGFATFAHELSHTLGTEDVYGATGHSYEVTLMSATMYSREDDLHTYHLDPWHKIQLGWIKPRIHPLSNPGSAAALSAAQVSPNPDKAPLILYDPHGGYDAYGRPNEYFILEFRNPNLAPGGGYDANVADSGLAVWYVQTDADGILATINGLRIKTGGDQILQTVPAPGSDDIRGTKSVKAGDDCVLQTRPDPRDIFGEDKANFLIGAPNGCRGASSLWTDADGEFELQLSIDQWAEPTGTGLHLRVGSISPTSSYVDLEWNTSGPLSLLRPRIDRLAAPSGAPGYLLAVEGVFGLQGRKIVSLSDGLRRYDMTIVGWMHSRIFVRVPPGTPAGDYRLLVYTDAGRIFSSNEVAFRVSR